MTPLSLTPFAAAAFFLLLAAVLPPPAFSAPPVHQQCLGEQAYKRSLYLKSWDRSAVGCKDTRHAVLARDARRGTLKYKTSKKCVVTSGVWYDPYTGKRLTKPSQIHVDHVVPLAVIHRDGGCNWAPLKRRMVANDMSNLLVTWSRSNLRKSDNRPQERMPMINRCTYLLVWRNTKMRFGLVISPAEAHFLDNYQNCDWRR